MVVTNKAFQSGLPKKALNRIFLPFGLTGKYQICMLMLTNCEKE